MSRPCCELWFYQLERLQLAPVLASLLEKAADRGWRGLVRGTDRERLKALDAALWTFRDASFLPHGLDEEPNAALQPVLLTTEAQNLNGAELLVLLDGAEPGPLEDFQRCLVVFEQADEPALQAARALWRGARAAGRPASFWREAGEGWSRVG